MPFVDSILGFIDRGSERRKGEEKEKGEEKKRSSLEHHDEMMLTRKKKKGARKRRKEETKERRCFFSRVFGVGVERNLGVESRYKIGGRIGTKKKDTFGALTIF